MIGLMDCNNFFVSCERLFRPDLIGKPVIVLSSNDGCAVSRSQEVKDLGISMGIPYFEIKEICKKEKITVFSSNFSLYRDISRRVMTALKEEFEECSVYSIDEAFFKIGTKITESEMAEIRARIIQKTGIPVSIGIAKTKTLAKVANRIAKGRSGNVRLRKSNMEGVCIMDDGIYKDEVLELPCGSIWGIGRQTSALLSKHKIHTVSDFLAQDQAFIKRTFGMVGERIRMELAGTQAYGLSESEDEEQSSYTSTRSFGSPVHDKYILQSALCYHTTHVAKKLRDDACTASQITIIARGSRYGAFAHREGFRTVTLLEPTNSTMVLIKEVARLLGTLYDAEIPYKKAGVILSGIRPQHMTAQSLFADHDAKKKMREIDSVSDILAKRFGNNILRSGVVYETQKWQERKQSISKAYTTKWTDIAFVKAT